MSSFFSPRSLACLAAPLLLVACSGEVSPGGGQGGVGAGSGTGTGTGGAGMPPGTAQDPKGPIVSRPVASSRMVRLNNQQWENTVRDVLRLPTPLGLSKDFVAQPLETGFDTNGAVLTVDPNSRDDFQTAAEAVAKKVAREPQLLAAVAPAGADAAARARTFVQTFGLRAFRRPLTDADVERYVALFNRGGTLLASGDAFADGVELVLRALFQSPHFLYRVESSTTVVDGRIPLGDYEIASRLSYSLANTMPDDLLLTAAATKKLQTREAVVEHAQRLVNSPAGQAAVANFHQQLLRLRDYDQINKDVQKAPAFTPEINADLKQEALSFVSDVIYKQDRGIAELLSAPYTFVNSKVAKIYGLNVPTPAAGQPDPFVRVNLDPTQRAGLLTQAGFLASNADDQVPQIIIRGVHIARDVLCVPLPAPPDVVPPLPALDPTSTNRSRVETLTKNAPCSTCHTSIINPLGFAFERLDGFAQYRTQENGKPIDATGTYSIDGKDVKFDGALDLIKAIAGSQQAHDCYASHLTQYLYGRDVDVTLDPDKNLVAQAGLRAKANPSTKALIVNLVATDAFLSRAP